MKNIFRIICTVLLAAVFVVSTAVSLAHIRERRLAHEAYKNAIQIALPAENEITVEEIPPAPMPLAPEPEPTPLPGPVAAPAPESAPEALPEEAQYLVETDLDALREVNEDVIGWFCIPGTEISYPLMRSKDNKEYLNLTWDLQYSKAGSIFMERRSSTDLSDFHTLIYGHNLYDGRMFSSLMKYREQEYFEAHPTIYIAVDEVIYRYEVFSSYIADVLSDSYRIVFEDDEQKQRVVDFYVESSETDSGIAPTAEDKILSLSTCTGWGNNDIRCIVHAVQTGVFER